MVFFGFSPREKYSVTNAISANSLRFTQICKSAMCLSAKHEQAKSIALLFYTGICAEDGKLTSRNIESLFKILQYECRYNYKETRKRVLNFKSYK